jgi:hypothetical protein
VTSRELPSGESDRHDHQRAGAAAPSAPRTQSASTAARVAMLAGLLPIAAEGPRADPLDKGMNDLMAHADGAPYQRAMVRRRWACWNATNTDDDRCATACCVHQEKP